MNFDNLLLGRRPHQPHKLAAAPQLRTFASAWSAPPLILDRRGVPFQPTLGRNNILPDCTAVGLWNSLGAWAALDGLPPVPMQDDPIQAFYAASIGAQDDTETLAQTNGAEMIEVLRFQRLHGIDPGDGIRRVADCAVVNPRDRFEAANVMARGGILYMGVALSQSDKAPGTWDTIGRPGDPTPGSWGLHCCGGWDYTGLGDDDTLRIATWGALQPATWRWFDAHCEEAYLVIWPRELRADGTNWIGLDHAALLAENRQWIQ